jgi:transcription elongation factor Elf1
MKAWRRSRKTGAVEPHSSPGTLCATCGDPVVSEATSTRVADIAQVEAGWIARGTIEEYGYCGTCGQAYELLARDIPIECAAFPCPSCGPDSNLTPDILSITESGARYSFVALLKCDACSKPQRFSKLLGVLSNITRIKVGPTGVEVEVKP